MIGGSEAALGSLYDRHVNVVFAAAVRTGQGSRGRCRGRPGDVPRLVEPGRTLRPRPWVAPVVVADDRAQSGDRSAPGCRTPRPRRGLLVVRAGRPGRSVDRRMAYLVRRADRVGENLTHARGRPDESRGSIGDRGRRRRAGSHGTGRDRARLRLGSVPVRDRGPTGLAHRDGQDADATRVAPSPRSACRDALEHRGRPGAPSEPTLRPPGSRSGPGCAGPCCHSGRRRRGDALGHQCHVRRRPCHRASASEWVASSAPMSPLDVSSATPLDSALAFDRLLGGR